MTSVAARSTAEQASVTCLPTHECVPIDPLIVTRIDQNKDLILDANTCGRFDAVTHIVTCTERRVYVRCDCPRHPDAPTRGHKKCQKCKTVGFVVVEKIPTNCSARFRRNLYGLCEQIW